MTFRPFGEAETRSEWRLLLLIKRRGLCAICGHRFPREGELSKSAAIAFAPTFDHIVPRSRGGTDSLDNLRLAHRKCNHARGDGSVSKPTPTVPRVLRQG